MIFHFLRITNHTKNVEYIVYYRSYLSRCFHRVLAQNTDDRENIPNCECVRNKQVSYVCMALHSQKAITSLQNFVESKRRIAAGLHVTVTSHKADFRQTPRGE